MLNPSQKKNYKKIFLASCCELSIAVTYSVATSYYAAPKTNWIEKPAASAAFFTLLNFLLRLIEKKYIDEEKYSFIFLLIRGAAFGLMDYDCRGVLVHETGHVIFANYLYQHANPEIQISCRYLIGCGGTTIFNHSLLSNAGERLGNNSSDFLQYASGVSFNNAFAFLGLLVGEVLPAGYIESKSHIRWAAVLNILASIIYALSPYFFCGENNDFCDLQSHGVPPAAAASLLLITSLIMQISLSCSSHYCHRNRNNNVLNFPRDENVTTMTTLDTVQTRVIMNNFNLDEPSVSRPAIQFSSNRNLLFQARVIKAHKSSNIILSSNERSQIILR